MALSAAENPRESTRVQVCGRLSLEIDGVQLADRLRGRQVRLLLAYLLLNRSRHVGREELIGALWPERPPVSQDAALRTLLSRLRSAVGGAALAGREHLILELPEPVWVDLEAAESELRRAQQALARRDARSAWALAQVPLNIAGRGLLPGLQASWLEPARRELEEMRLQALEVIGAAGLGMGTAQLGSVERSARTLIADEPYRESGYVLLMDALAMRGNVAEGLRVFEQLRKLLREELGTTPSPEAVAAHDRLLQPLRGGTARAEISEAPVAESPIPLPPELRVRASSPLVGREDELSELTRLWDVARAGGFARPAAGGAVVQEPRQIVVLAGEAGIGKTSLAAELARRAHEQGGLVLAGRAQEEGLAPYQPFLEALRHYFALAPPDELGPAVREYGPELARLVPELRRHAPELSRTDPGEPDSERYRLFEAFVGLLCAIADRAPILLVLDDLHWADRPTLLLLRHLSRATEPGRLLTLVAYRSEARFEPLLDALADLRRERLLSVLEIGGLDERATAELVRVRTGESPSHAFVRAVHAETEGNPLFIEEIVRNLVGAGVRAGAATASEVERFALPEGVKHVIVRRLSRLDPRTVETLRVASVIGRDFDVALLEQLAGLEEDEFLSALEEALGAGVLHEIGAGPASGRYSFSHQLIQEALYEGISAPRRARVHRRVGETLEAAGGQALGILALHFTRAAAGPDEAEKAISYARQAAAQATEMLAHEEAARHCSRALEVLTRLDPNAEQRRLELLLDLAEAQVRAGEREPARDVFREAAQLAQRVGDRSAYARAAIGASRRYVQQPGVIDTELIEMIERGLAITAEEVSIERVRLLYCLCGAIYYSAQRHRMPELSAEAARIADELGDPRAQAYARAARRRALANVSHLSERLAASTEMLTLARQVDDRELQLQAHAWLVVDLLESGQPDAVDAQIEAFTAGAEQLRQPLYLWQAGVWRAMQAHLAGTLTEAEELAADALAAGAPGESVTAPQYYAIQLLTIRREQGRMGELEPAARQMVQANPHFLAWRSALATLLAETGRPGDAREEFEQVASGSFQDIPDDGDWMTTVALLADLAADLQDAQRAGALYDMLLPYAGLNVVIGLGAACLGPVDRLLGRLAATTGRQEEAQRWFESALVAAERLRSPVWLAHTRVDFAQVLGGRSVRARRMLDDAREAAAGLGLVKIAARADRVS